ncbi:hypothetical protein MKW94_018796 [Papaver nudicaule]|uniref:DRBM domain-containing protein n=1 Tax=Papaver nudicaule TaxID=74823 RepID=A0AA41V843_PAPNU|nr:hypothetical protein [Papaver nudicaule]
MSNSKEFQGVSSCYVFKSRLQEYAQKNKFLTPVYETLKEGPAHEPYFRSSVIVNDFKYDSLPGFCNRKAAEQSAAEVALIELAKLGNTDDSIRNPVHESGLCKNLLQEYAQKMNYAVPSYVCRMSETRGKGTAYTSTVDIGGIQYIGAAARTKKEAKLKAARTALLAIQSSSYGSHTNPSGNCQLTVLPPIKKDPEPVTAVDITKESLKPRKNKFKKKWPKRKFPKKNGDQVTTDPTGEASGSTVIGNAETSNEIHTQGSGAVDAHMNDQNGSGLERLTTEEAFGHTLNTSDVQALGSAALGATMDMDIQTAQDVGSANGGRLPTEEAFGHSLNVNDDQALCSAALEATMDIEIQTIQEVGSANGSSLGRLPTEKASGHTLDTNVVQALGSAAVGATIDIDIRATQDVGSANGNGLERLPTEEASGYSQSTNNIQALGSAAVEAMMEMDIQTTQDVGSANGNGLERLSAGEGYGKTVVRNLENTNGIQSQGAAAAEAHLDMNIQSKRIGGLASGSGFERMARGEASGNTENINEIQAQGLGVAEINMHAKFVHNGGSENGTESGGGILSAEANLTFQEIKMEVQNDQGFSQNVESENVTRSGLERLPELEANQSFPDVKLEFQNDQGFSQNVESKNGTGIGLQRPVAEPQRSLQEVEMEVQIDQEFFQNFELQIPTDIELEVQNDQGFFQNVESKKGTANDFQRLPAEEQKSLEEVELEAQNEQGVFQNLELQNGTTSGLEMFPTKEQGSFQDDEIEVQDDQGFSM